jgi:hypothetical protein
MLIFFLKRINNGYYMLAMVRADTKCSPYCTIYYKPYAARGGSSSPDSMTRRAWRRTTAEHRLSRPKK